MAATTHIVVELSLTGPEARSARGDPSATRRGPSLGELCYLLDHAGLVPGHMVGRASDRRSLPYGLRVRAIRFAHPHRSRHPAPSFDASEPDRPSVAPARPASSLRAVAAPVRSLDLRPIPTGPVEEGWLGKAHRH